MKPHPLNLIIHRQSHTLEIEWHDHNRIHYPFELLRIYSPSAEVRGHGGRGAKLQLDKQDVVISDIKPVGHYAIKIFFDDGHHTGLYDWAYLHDLGLKQELYWNRYLQQLFEAGHKHKEPSWKTS